METRARVVAASYASSIHESQDSGDEPPTCGAWSPPCHHIRSRTHCTETCAPSPTRRQGCCCDNIACRLHLWLCYPFCPSLEMRRYSFHCLLGQPPDYGFLCTLQTWPLGAAPTCSAWLSAASAVGEALHLMQSFVFQPFWISLELALNRRNVLPVSVQPKALRTVSGENLVVPLTINLIVNGFILRVYILD